MYVLQFSIYYVLRIAELYVQGLKLQFIRRINALGA